MEQLDLSARSDGGFVCLTRVMIHTNRLMEQVVDPASALGSLRAGADFSWRAPQA